MKKPFKNRFPVVLLCFTLILAIVVSGLTYPGFLLPLFGEKDTSVKIIAEKQAFVEGNSKAFSIEPAEGVTISAEENALDKDREIKMEAVSDEQFAGLAKTFATEFSEQAEMVYSWELDAGLADDELLPEGFEMKFDLEKLGIDPKLYPYTELYRIDDNGKWYQYATGLEGSVLTADSNQNCIISMIVWPSLIVFGLYLYSAIEGKINGGYTFAINQNKFDVEIDGKTRFQIYWNLNENLAALQKECNSTADSILKRAEERTVKELKQKYGDSTVEKWFVEEEGEKVFNPKDSGRIKEYETIRDEYIASIKRKDETYLKLESQLQDIKEGRGDSLKEEFLPVERAIKGCELAYEFLKSELKLQLPKYMIRIELVPNPPANGVTVSPMVGNPYCIIDSTRGDFLSSQKY